MEQQSLIIVLITGDEKETKEENLKMRSQQQGNGNTVCGNSGSGVCFRGKINNLGDIQMSSLKQKIENQGGQCHKS